MFAEAIAIVRPRLQKMAATEMGIQRSIGGGPSTVTSGAFALLNELPRLGVRRDRQPLDAVDARRQERRRRVLEAAASVSTELPRLIQVAALKAAAGHSTITVGRNFDRR